MAEASLENMTLDRRTRIDLVKRIFQLMKDNSLDNIKQIFESLPPEQSIKVLNSSINGFILLYAAVLLNNVEISRYLLKLSLLQETRKMSESWKHYRHPLIAAIFSGNEELIKLILQHLPNINDYICGPFPPLMIAIFLENLISVKLIVAMGADINRPCFQGRTPLMYSTFNSEVCSFLLSQGANVNDQDDEGFTAIHLAIGWNHTEGLNLLFDAGADVRIQNHQGINPLIGAIISLNMPMVRCVSSQPAYSELERIEALEMLNACCLCAQKSSITGWIDTLHLRTLENFPKNTRVPAQELLDFSEEFTTEAELENLQGKSLRLAYQSILVVERILGRNNRLYMQFLLQMALIAKKENNMEKVRQLIDYIQEYCHETSFVGVNLRYFKDLFSGITDHSNPKIFFEYGGFAIFKIIARSAIKMWNHLKDHIYLYPFFEDSYYPDIVDSFLYMASITNTLPLTREYLNQFREEIKGVIKEDLRVLNHLTVLHRAIKLIKTLPWGSVELIEILLESGADANSKDYFGRTPIMYAVKHASENILNDVLALLLEHGGHPDYRNGEGFTAMDDAPLGCCLMKTPRSLQCLSTEVILDNEVAYEGSLPKIIQDSVTLHK